MQNEAERGLTRSLVLRIKQAMQVDDEIPHVGVVDGLLSLRLPGS